MIGVMLPVLPSASRRARRGEGKPATALDGRETKVRVGVRLLMGLFVVATTATTATTAGAADLRITDTRGTEVVVQAAAIDYGGFVSSELETQGIRLMQGDGSVTVKWSDIETLKVTRRDDSVKPPRIEMEVVLKNQKKVPAALLRQGRMKLTGKTELGDYSIDLDKIRAITPVK